MTIKYKKSILFFSFLFIALQKNTTYTAEKNQVIGKKRNNYTINHHQQNADVDTEIDTDFTIENISKKSKPNLKSSSQLARTKYLKLIVKQYGHINKSFSLLREYYGEEIPTFYNFLDQKIDSDDYKENELINENRNCPGTVIGYSEDFIIEKMKNPFCMALEYIIRNHINITDEANKIFQHVIAYHDTKMQPIIQIWLNERSKHNQPMLHQAVQFNNKEMITFLLKAQADINIQDTKGDTALNKALKSRRINIMHQLLEAHANPNIANFIGYTPLLTAVKNGNLDIVEILLENNAHPNILNKTQSTPLYEATLINDLFIVDALLLNHADPNLGNNTNYSPLYKAAENCAGEKDTSDAEEIMLILLQSGANPNIHIEIHDNTSPLHLTAMHNNAKATQLLLENNADINIVDDNNITPLYEAARKGSLATVQLLINSNANLNICGTQDYGTALHAAVKNNFKEIARILLLAGIDRTIVDQQNHQTAQMLIDSLDILILFEDEI